MKIAGIHVREFEEDGLLDVEPVAGWAWAKLIVHCSRLELGEGVADQEIGLARIRGAKSAPDSWWSRQWVTKAEVDSALRAGLVFWDGPDLMVRYYDLNGQRKVEMLRAVDREKKKSRRVKLQGEARPSLPSPSLTQPSPPLPSPPLPIKDVGDSPGDSPGDSVQRYDNVGWDEYGARFAKRGH